MSKRTEEPTGFLSKPMKVDGQWLRSKKALRQIALVEVARLEVRLATGGPCLDPKIQGDPPLSGIPARIAHIKTELAKIELEIKKGKPQPTSAIRV